ncbi:MAG: response regulator transcription factor [Terriglobales bacterium]
MRVLVIEDEARLAANLAQALRENTGYAVDVASDGAQGLYLAQAPSAGGAATYDLIVLDLMLPALDGESLLRRYRAGDGRTPVLVLTAREGKASVVALLNAGADDYLTKPFDMGECLARAKALIRRGNDQRDPVLRLGDLEVYTVERRVRRGGRELRLTPMEYRVLEYLAHRPRAVVSKAELSEHLYDFNWEKFSNVIEVYVSGLRRKLDGPFEPKLIQTLRGQGYSLRLDTDGPCA